MKKILLCIALLIFANISFGADDPRLRVYPQQGIMNFKGLDEKSSPTNVQDGRALEAQNVQFSSTGAVAKRNGYSLVNGSLKQATVDFQAITGLYYIKLSSGTAYRVAICGSRIYWDNSGTWQQIPDFSVTYGQNNQFVFTTALDSIVFTNDVDTPKKWLGNPYGVNTLSFTGLTNNLSKSKCVVWYKNYLIWGNTVEGGVEKPTRIRWSNVGTIETYSDDDYIDIGELGGQEIEGFGILQDNLYVFLTDSIHKVSLVGGDEIFNISKVVEGTGCIAKNSIQNIALQDYREGLIFLSKDKTINFFDGVNIANASYLIPTTMNALATSRLPYAVSAEDGSDYYLAVTTGSTATTNNLVLDLQYETGDWSKHTQIDANSMTKVLDSDSDTQVYFGNYDSFVYQLYDSSLNSDIGGATGIFESSAVVNIPTVTGATVIFDNDATFTCTGAIVRILSGTGKGEEKVIIQKFTNTGILVDSAFTDTPDTTSIYSIGDIEAIYTTKWYDFGNPARRKHFGEIFFWAEEQGNMSSDVTYAKDFMGYSSANSVSFQGAGALWGTGIWGTDVWGGQEALLKKIKVLGDGRYLKFKVQEDDIDETFNIYGFNMILWDGDVQ